ncbi:MAG: hypothetical protein M1605_04625 [Candidatus Thermoplasmatota archaeon]|nr:hypothetical protein [Candidatus Thermoplasmatota archaeon]
MELKDDQFLHLVELLGSITKEDYIRIISDRSPQEVYRMLTEEISPDKFNFISYRADDRNWAIILKKR